MNRINTNPSPKDLRAFGLILVPFAVVPALVAHFIWESPALAQATGITGGGLALIFWAVPPLRRWIYVGWTAAVFPIGWTVSRVILLFVYLVVITPIGLILRLISYDPLGRRFEPGKESYWEPYNPGEDPQRYFRQF